MNDTLQARLGALGEDVRAAALPGGCKRTAAWCMGKLPALYAEFRQTNESRYGEEIVRLVRAALKELGENMAKCPEAGQLAASTADRLRLLHEEFGVPSLDFKPLRPRK